MAYAVKPLFNIALDFVSRNANSVESFVGLPPLIGEQVFQRCVELGMLKDPCENEVALRLFVEAYREKVMVSMRIVDGLIFINEHFNQLKIVTKYLCSLDLSYCGLGSHHEMMHLIGRLSWLKNLSLRHNFLSDDAIRNITLPAILFDTGLANLEHLDLSNNRHLSDNMIIWLRRLKQLNYLNLTATGITDAGRFILKEKCNLLPCENAEFERMPIVTVGWAEIMLEKWADIIARRLKERIKRKQSIWAGGSGATNLVRKVNIPFACTRYDSLFIFKKSMNVEPQLPDVEVDEQIPAEMIEEEIFNQYR